MALTTTPGFLTALLLQELSDRMILEFLSCKWSPCSSWSFNGPWNSGGARRVASPEPGATDGGFSKAGKLMKDKNPIELMKDRRMDSPMVMGQLW